MHVSRPWSPSCRRRPRRSPAVLLGAVTGALLAAVPASARAELGVSSLIGDHMVLQQRAVARIEGTDAPATVVHVTLAPATLAPAAPATAAAAAPVASASATADASGRWRAALAVPAAGGPFRLTVAGSTTV